MILHRSPTLIRDFYGKVLIQMHEKTPGISPVLIWIIYPKCSKLRDGLFHTRAPVDAGVCAAGSGELLNMILLQFASGSLGVW